MRIRKLSFIVLLYASCITVQAQQSIEQTLEQIEKNNKTLLAQSTLLEAQRIRSKTGITPSDPVAEYDYMAGRPADAGNQHDFILSQGFDFPTVYLKKAQLAGEQIRLAEFEALTRRQEILLKAKLLCIELIYHNKLQKQIGGQKQNCEELLEGFKKRLESGEGSVLDVNKARLQLIELNREIQENTSAITRITEKLTELNGGIPLSMVDTFYSVSDRVPEYDSLRLQCEERDPLRQSLEQQKMVSSKELEVSRSLWMPRLELGYHYQGILGQTYNGVHTGVSIPLWENRNTIKYSETKVIFDDLNLADYSNAHYSEIRQNYDKYLSIKTTLEEYRNTLTEIQSNVLLNKALRLGQISAIEYYMELNYFNASLKHYLATERDYYAICAELLKYKL